MTDACLIIMGAIIGAGLAFGVVGVYLSQQRHRDRLDIDPSWQVKSKEVK